MIIRTVLAATAVSLGVLAWAAAPAHSTEMRQSPKIEATKSLMEGSGFSCERTDVNVAYCVNAKSRKVLVMLDSAETARNLDEKTVLMFCEIAFIAALKNLPGVAIDDSNGTVVDSLVLCSGAFRQVRL